MGCKDRKNDLRFDWVNFIDADLTNWSKNITAPSESYIIQLDRKVTADDLYNSNLDIMPGFRLTWNYNKHVEPVAKYRSKVKNKQFVRYNFLKERNTS